MTKRAILIVAALLAVSRGMAGPAAELGPVAVDPGVRITNLSLDGEIRGENIIFTLRMQADVVERSACLPLVVGDVAYLGGALPKGSDLRREGDGYVLELVRAWRPAEIEFRFASRAVERNGRRETEFAIPLSDTRRLGVICDRADLDVSFPGSLQCESEPLPDGRKRVTAYLGLQDRFAVSWKPEVRRFDSELMAACETHTVAAASVGALRLKHLLAYSIIQGQLQSLAVEIGDASVTRVAGEEILEWHVETGKPNVLIVTLNRPQEDAYRLVVEAELPLAVFPARFALPLPAPRDVIRATGFVLIGSHGAIKLQSESTAALTQIDPQAFAWDDPASLPSRSVLAYQYASAGPRMNLRAEDVAAIYTADSRLAFTVGESELSLDASLELNVREAPLREVRLRIDPDPAWTVTETKGADVAEADVDIREEGGQRLLVVPFKQAVTGTTLIRVRLERVAAKSAAGFSIPIFDVVGAEAHRGHIVAAAARGIRLKTDTAEGVREVFTGAAPMRVPGAQQAYRFKTSGWHVVLSVARSRPAIHCEVFHLVSVGEGILYTSAALTYHIGGAPVQELRVRVPASVRSAEFTGVDVEGWQREEDIYTVRLRRRIMDDYTLLVSYEEPYAYKQADVTVGGVATLDTDSEVGFIAVASPLSLNLTPAPLPDSVLTIDRGEIPPAYAAAVSHPILAAFKYVGASHGVGFRLEPFDAAAPLGQVADYTRLESVMSGDGEVITTARYFIKNATRQFLVLQLADGVDLWSIRQRDENGGWQDVPAQKSDDGVLIPVSRPRDSNHPMELEVTYAQGFGKPNTWRGGVRGVELLAPALPSTHTAFVSWQVTLPEPLCIGAAGGSVVPDSPLRMSAWRRCWTAARSLWRAVLDGPGGRRLSRVLTKGAVSSSPYTFSRSVALAGEAAPVLRLTIVPGWVGQGGSVRVLLLALASSGLVAALARRARARRRSAIVIGAILLIGLLYTATGTSLLGMLVGAGALITLLLVLARLALAGFRYLSRQVRRRRFARESMLDMLQPFERGPAPTEGSARPALLVMLFALMAGAAMAAHQSAPRVHDVQMTIEGPATARDAERSAAIALYLTFETDSATELVLIPPAGVLIGHDFDSKHLSIRADPTGYVLVAERGGTYSAMLQYRTPVTESEGEWNLELLLPPSMRNRVVLEIPETQMQVTSPAAVLFECTETNGVTRAEAVYGAAARAGFTWRARVRRADAEQAVLYAETVVAARLLPGLVELEAVARYQVARGAIREARVNVPEGLAITAVRAEHLATWSFDPASRTLHVVLDAPVSGEWDLQFDAQLAVASEGTVVTLGAFTVVQADRQRGSLVIAAPPDIQVRVGETMGVSPMNLEDFPAACPATAREAGLREAVTRRKAYRYAKPAAVRISLETERVLPEIRVAESGTLSVAEERIVRSAKLLLTLAKTGVFSVVLQVPRGYDVETLTGPDVAHWEELGAVTPVAEDGDARGEQAVTVYFTKRVDRETEINLVLAATERTVAPQVLVPRISVVGARWHTGSVTVSSERGVRLMVASQRGVDMRASDDVELSRPGILVIDILRPAWQVDLRAEVMAATVRPEILHIVDLAEGMLRGRALVRYRIEDAGVKQLLLQAPAPGAALTVAGENIARVSEVDAAAGIWSIDLHNKVEGTYALTATYQIPCDAAARRVQIAPVRCVGVEPSRGFLVVTSAGRLQIRPATDQAAQGLLPEDPRQVPVAFGAGDLAHAIRCYRVVDPDAVLALDVERHQKADVLPAIVEHVRLTSAMSSVNQLLTRVEVELRVGDHRFLRMELPDSEDSLWTVLVDGREVAAAREADHYLIPLEATADSALTRVEVVYAGRGDAGLLTRRYRVPRFGLPLNDVEWTIYVPPTLRYGGLGGTMTPITDGAIGELRFDTGRYRVAADAAREESLSRARDELGDGEALRQAGRQREAKRAFLQALTYSQSEADLNEDARVQLRSLEKQQWKVAFLDRRKAVRLSRNILAPAGSQPVAGGDGSFTPDAVAKLEQDLDVRDRAGLELVATRMMSQQVAAEAVVSAIRATVPQHGRILRFQRAVQIDADGELSVQFRVYRGAAGGMVGAVLIVMLVLGSLLWRKGDGAKSAK